MVFDLVVQIHDMEDVQELAFVLMKPLYLYIKNGPRVNINAVMLFDVFCKTQLVLVFNIHELLLCLRVVCVYLHLSNLGKICDPLVSDMVCYPVCKKRVCMEKESSLCDTVCLVVELLRHHLIEISQLLILQDLCVEPCNTVYRIACNNGQMCHFYLSVIDDSHLADLLLIARIFSLDLLYKAAVNLLDDLVDTRKQS